MKLTIRPRTPMMMSRWIQHAMLVGGFGLLAYCGFVLMGAWAFQRSSRQEVMLLSGAREKTGYEKQGQVSGPKPIVSRVARNGLIGFMEIRRIGLSATIVEGTSGAALRRAAGHISGTALPGEVGNIGISGHRDTLFRPLKDVMNDDVISVTTALGEYRYRVVSITVVSPTDVSVLNSDGGGETLTLVTCHPFFYVGPAPGRFIVRAERVATNS